MSTKTQNPSLQIDALLKEGISEKYVLEMFHQGQNQSAMIWTYLYQNSEKEIPLSFGNLIVLRGVFGTFLSWWTSLKGLK